MKTTVSSIKQFTALVVSLLLLTSFCDLQAQTVWTNAAGGDWNTAINWKPNTIPGVGTATYMTNGLPAYTVTYTGPMGAASIGSLTVTNVNTTTSNATLTVSASGFNVSGGITVGNGGVLNLNSGAVMNEAGTLTLNSGGQVNVAAGAVLTNSTLSISSGVYAQSGGNVTNSSVTPVGTGFAVVGGTFVDTTWNGSAGSSTGGKWFVTGAGTFVNFGNYTSSRTGGNGNPTQAAPNNNGLIISNGVVLFSSITFPGTVNGNYNSDSQINIWGGFVTNTGTFSMCEDNNRLSEFYQMGGTFANLNSSMVIGAAAAANIAATLRGFTFLDH